MSSYQITAVIIFAIFSLAHVTATPWIAEPRASQSWLDKHQRFKHNTVIRGNISVVFYGDSITEGWCGAGRKVFDSRYAPLGTANYGISGDKTENLLYRITNGETEGLSPKLVVLKIGTNNLGSDSNDDIVRGVRAVVELLLEQVSSAKPLLLGILPRNDAKYFTRVADVNIKISKLHDGKRVFFLDMFNQFAVAWGEVDLRLFNGDKLHLEAPGYDRWAETMDHIFIKLYQNP